MAVKGDSVWVLSADNFDFSIHATKEDAEARLKECKRIDRVLRQEREYEIREWELS